VKILKKIKIKIKIKSNYHQNKILSIFLLQQIIKLSTVNIGKKKKTDYLKAELEL